MLLVQLSYNLQKDRILSRKQIKGLGVFNHLIKEPNHLCRKTEDLEISLKNLIVGLHI